MAQKRRLRHAPRNRLCNPLSIKLPAVEQGSIRPLLLSNSGLQLHPTDLGNNMKIASVAQNDHALVHD